MGKRGRPPKKLFHPTPVVSSVRVERRAVLSSKPTFGRKRKLDDPLPSVNLINIIGNASVKSFLTVENFVKLPLPCRRQLLKLLPECDRTVDELGKPKLASNALNNEYFTHACLDFKDRLLSGSLTSEGFAKDTKLNRSTLEKLDPWKLKHFEAYFGEKLKNVDCGFNDDLNLNFPRKTSLRKASILELPPEILAKKKTVSIFQPKLRRGRPPGRPRKIMSIPSVVKQEESDEPEVLPLPKMKINLKKKTICFCGDGKSPDVVREWVEMPRSTSHSPKPSTELGGGIEECLPSESIVPISSTLVDQTQNKSIEEEQHSANIKEELNESFNCDAEVKALVENFSQPSTLAEFQMIKLEPISSHSDDIVRPVITDPRKIVQRISDSVMCCQTDRLQNNLSAVQRPGSVPVTRSQTLQRRLCTFTRSLSFTPIHD